MPSSITDTIKRIPEPDSESAEIDISAKIEQVFRLNCISKESEAPNCFLVFPPKKLPYDIDTNKACPVAIKSDQAATTLTAKIKEVNGNRTLHLRALKKSNLKVCVNISG